MKKTILLCVIVTLALGICGCKNETSSSGAILGEDVDVGFDTEAYPQVTLRTPEEIKATGVTPQDISDLLSKYVLDAFKYARYEYKDDAGDSWEKISAKGLCIRTMYEDEKTDEGKMKANYYPFYYCAEEFYFQHNWFHKGGLYELDVQNPLHEIYYVTLSGIVVIDGKGFYKDWGFFGVSESDFEMLADAFELKSFELTQEMRDNYPIYTYVGQKVYEPKEFSAEEMNSYTQEQLDALYYVLTNSFATINFEGRLPNGDVK